MRAVLTTLGAALAGYGAWLLLSRESSAQVREALTWLAASVILHDAVLSPVVIALGWFGGRLLPRWAAVGGAALVVLGPVTLIAIPVLGRFGADPTNPTLLGRDYWSGWLVIAVVTVIAACVGARWRELRSPRGRQQEGRVHGARARRRRRSHRA